MKITDSIQYVERFFEAKQRFRSLMLHFKKGCPIFFEFVFGEKHRTPLDLEQFTAEVENIYQDLYVRHTEIDNNFSCILVTVLYECRKCNKTLQIKGDYKKVTIYDYAKGTSTGIRFTKFCRQCFIYEHAGYYVQDGYRLLDLENFEKYDILLSTEDTAFTKRTLKTFSWELVIGHMAFMTKAEIYNKSFSYKIPSHKRKR